MNRSGPRKYDLTECDREPIHALGYIQPFGALLAVNADWNIVHYSANAADILGYAGEVTQGQKLQDIMRQQALARIRDIATTLPEGDTVERLFGIELVESRLFDCAVHCQDGIIVIEFEPHPESKTGDHLDTLRPLMRELDPIDDVAGLCEKAARQLKGILGFDRIMVYRFHPDGSGEVIAEEREDHLEPFLGLRYPRTDVPEQARELYLRNRFRIISDVSAEPVEILPSETLTGEPLDLSMSTLRAVSPIHIQYLQNMGVDASLSISIVHQGRLWGLFACHNYTPQYLPFAVRTLAELFSQLFSLALDRALVSNSDAMRSASRKLHDQLMMRLAEGRSLIENLPILDSLLNDVIEHDGLSIYVDGSYRTRGAAPDLKSFEAILPALNAAPTSRVVASNSLGSKISAAKSFADVAAGALIIPISRTPRDYLVLWRRELPQTVVWAGNPDKAVSSEEGKPLTPRSSFAAWEQSVRGESSAWSEEEFEIADGMRVSLIEVVLRLTDEAERERRKAQQQQDLLIAELNHRVRNILNLIRSLIDQSRHEAIDITEFVDIIGGRISALASAHDNITRENWSPAPISKLIEAEVEAYLSEKRERLRLSGDNVLITPEAYTVLALVIHEMVTNSAKYGSLCDRRGELDIALTRTREDDLVIEWRERGGPPVKEPTRRGFGSTIIERSIPFELKGDARLDFKETGLEARFRIPSQFVREVDENEASDTLMPAANGSAPNGDASASALPANVLLVEDSMIIALDAEEVLKGFGIGKVTTTGSVDGAITAIEGSRPDFAIVDFNLGHETSEPVIAKLAEEGIPFVLATGYGDLDGKAGEMGALAVLRKPYGKPELLRIVPGAGKS